MREKAEAGHKFLYVAQAPKAHAGKIFYVYGGARVSVNAPEYYFAHSSVMKGKAAADPGLNVPYVPAPRPDSMGINLIGAVNNYLISRRGQPAAARAAGNGGVRRARQVGRFVEDMCEWLCTYVTIIWSDM